MYARALQPELGLRVNPPPTAEAMRSLDVGALEHLNRGRVLVEERGGRLVASELTRKHLLQDAPLRIIGLFLRNAHYLRRHFDRGAGRAGTPRVIR